MGNENFLKSIGFQFADTELANANYFDHRLLWTPKRPKSPQLIKNRWIYVFAFVDGHKAILDGEYYADGKGSLTYLPGKTRRSVEPKSAPRRGTPVKEAWVKNVILKQVYKYAFVATRGRMGLDAIWDMENALHPIYERMNLADLSHFQDGADKNKYLAIIDPLVIALKLSEAYQAALNEAINYVIVHPHNPNNADVEVRNRKVHLAKMIKEYLMEPRGGNEDPLDLRDKHLDGRGATLESYLSDKESELRKKKWAAKNAARDLILYLNSVAAIAGRWYCGTLQSLESVGPVWLDAMGSCLSRLSETEEGREFQQYLIAREENGLMGYLFEPDDEKDRTEIRKAKLLAMRKAVTGFVIGFGEMAPALIVHSKVRAATRQKIIKSIKGFLTHTDLKWVERNRAGQVTHMMRMSRTSFHLEIEVGHAEADIKEWIDKGKPHWPEDTRAVEKADLFGKILQVIEFINFYYYMTRLGNEEGDPVQHTAEFVGATLDFVAAMEDPIRASAKAKDAAKAAGRGEGAALEAAGAEIRGPWTKLAAPAVFKILGGVSAAIDTWYNHKEANEAREKGNAALARAKDTIAGGSALIVAASVFNAVGYMTEIAILTAASATFLVFGIVLVTIGYVLVALFTTSPWQIYASHCCFGTTPHKIGHEDWSGGDFSTWTETDTGLDRQIMVLTAMLCAFKISGVVKMRGFGYNPGPGADAESISVTFGILPPASKLELEFDITYEGGRTHHPKYEINLDSMHVELLKDARGAQDLHVDKRGTAISTIVLSADRPPAAQGLRVEESTCAVLLRFAHRTTVDPLATGSIPAGGAFQYPIYKNSTLNTEQKSSLDFKPKGGE